MEDKKNIKSGYGTISLPLPLIEKVKKKIEGTGINSVSGYVAFILREILSYSREDSEKGKKDNKSRMELRQRLKNLGYI